MAAGWLGGHLAYALGVGVDTNAFVAAPPTGPERTSEPVPARDRHGSRSKPGRRQTRPDPADDRSPAAVLANRCSHRGGPLADGGWPTAACDAPGTAASST